MNAAFQPARHKGLTLVELMVSITILLIVAAIAVSELGTLPEESRRAAAADDARQLYLAYLLYVNGGDGRRIILTPAQVARGISLKDHGFYSVAANIEDVAMILAKSGDLNSGSVWFMETDPKLAGQPLPRLVIQGDIRIAKSCAPDFQKTQPKAWTFVVGLPASQTGSTQPLFWTRGLNPQTGRWSADSPWQGKGGHVMYLDGHVEWLESIPANAPGFQFTNSIGPHASVVPEVINAMGP